MTETISQVSAINEAHPRTWDDFERGCLLTFGGGYHDTIHGCTKPRWFVEVRIAGDRCIHDDSNHDNEADAESRAAELRRMA